MRRKDFKMKRIDRYIISQFLGTFAFIIVLMIAITVVFDINEKIDHFLKPEVTVSEIALKYYANFIPYFIGLFSPLFTFIAVILFTYRLADRSEIIAMLSSGISFNRLMFPYLLSAALIALSNYMLSAYVIPKANVNRIEFQNTYIRNQRVEYGRHVQLEVEPGVFAYFETFQAPSSMGYRFSLDQFEDKQLVSRLIASSIKYDSLHQWTIIDYIIRDFDGMYEHVSTGNRKDTTLTFMPSDFLISDVDCETMTSPALAKHIQRQKQRGIGNIQTFEIEYHRRYATIMSFFVLTVIGVSLSSRKIKGGMGLNIGIGLGLSFSYVFFSTVTSTFAISGLVSPMIAVWIPNILYLFITVYLFRRAPR